MPELIAGLIDVFADEPLTGNPLAVVQAADELSEEQMRRLAGEFNQAETTFILESARADRKLRSFTANGTEIFGAGHNALGAWLWLGEHGDLGPLTTPQTFYQEIGTDVLPIELEKIGARVHGRMRQAPLRLLDPLGNVDPLAKALGLDPCEILPQPTPRPAYTGATHLLVRVVNPETVDKTNPAAKELLGVLKAAGAEGCYIYAFDANRPQTAYARFFNPTVGLWEDAATGTAAGPLAAYLASEGLVANNELAIQRWDAGASCEFESISNPNYPGLGSWSCAAWSDSERLCGDRQTGRFGPFEARSVLISRPHPPSRANLRFAGDTATTRAAGEAVLPLKNPWRPASPRKPSRLNPSLETKT